eukprot:3750193-Alexandrium_andersonii.AAC.1
MRPSQHPGCLEGGLGVRLLAADVCLRELPEKVVVSSRVGRISPACLVGQALGHPQRVDPRRGGDRQGPV